MKITEKTWVEYITRLSSLNEKAGQKMAEYIASHGTGDGDELIAYAAALVQKYGEGSAELACQMYDAVAQASGANVPQAEPASPADYGETAKMVNGTKQSPALLQGGVSRLVKQAGADTTIKNAIRDGAEWAWVPHGDTCPFCIMLASRGWQKASKKALKGDHAQHIHAHCNCEYAIRFDNRTGVAGYDPDRYLSQYRNYGGDINAMRRAQYARDKEIINAQKRVAYRERKERGEVKTFNSLHFEHQPVTLEAISRVKEFECKTLDKTGSRQLQNAHKRLLTAASGKPLGVEVGQAFDLQMRPLTKLITGNSEGRKIKIQDFDTPYIALHTHPDCNIFSPGDLTLFVRRPNLKMLTAVGHDGHIYALEKAGDYQQEITMALTQKLQLEAKRVAGSGLPDAEKLSQIEKMIFRCIEEMENYGIAFYQ